jgi:hypothetical protein
MNIDNGFFKHTDNSNSKDKKNLLNLRHRYMKKPQ